MKLFLTLAAILSPGLALAQDAAPAVTVDLTALAIGILTTVLSIVGTLAWRAVSKFTGIAEASVTRAQIDALMGRAAEFAISSAAKDGIQITSTNALVQRAVGYANNGGKALLDRVGTEGLAQRLELEIATRLGLTAK